MLFIYLLNCYICEITAILDILPMEYHTYIEVYFDVTWDISYY